MSQTQSPRECRSQLGCSAPPIGHDLHSRTVPTISDEEKKRFARKIDSDIQKVNINVRQCIMENYLGNPSKDHIPIYLCHKHGRQQFEKILKELSDFEAIHGSIDDY